MADRDGNAKHAAAKPARRANASSAPLIVAAKRYVHLADQVDHSIRRWVIPAQDESDRPAAATARTPRQLGSTARARTARRRDGALSEVQAAIARALGAEYDLAQPLPDRLARLQRQFEENVGFGADRDERQASAARSR
jgi:hypothetical protein